MLELLCHLEPETASFFLVRGGQKSVWVDSKGERAKSCTWHFGRPKVLSFWMLGQMTSDFASLNLYVISYHKAPDPYASWVLIQDVFFLPSHYQKFVAVNYFSPCCCSFYKICWWKAGAPVNCDKVGLHFFFSSFASCILYDNMAGTSSEAFWTWIPPGHKIQRCQTDQIWIGPQLLEGAWFAASFVDGKHIEQ